MRILLRETTSAVLRAGLLAVALLVPGAALAQVPSILNPPYNVDAGVQITNTARTAGTVTTQPLSNLNYKGVVCTLVQTAVSGSPSTTFSIQSYDAATATWNTLGTSTAATSDTGSNRYTVWLQPGLIAADVPTNGVGKSLHLPRTWRVSQTVAGSGGPATTSKIGCNYLN